MVSDVPLTENILAQTPPFSITYYEWLSKEGISVFKRGGVINGSLTIYTVPDNHTLFITSAWLNIFNVSLLDSGLGFIEVVGDNRMLSMQTAVAVAAQKPHMATNTVFPIPLKVTSKRMISISGSTGTTTNSGFYGFLVANSRIIF